MPNLTNSRLIKARPFSTPWPSRSQQLRAQPASYRRAILLLSETIDQGSQTTLNEALRLVSDTNTAMYSFAFSSTRSAVSHEASKFGYGGNTDPGPAHGCFSREGADAEYEGYYSKQVLDCISQLAPPLRLATMAFLTAQMACVPRLPNPSHNWRAANFFTSETPKI